MNVTAFVEFHAFMNFFIAFNINTHFVLNKSLFIIIVIVILFIVIIVCSICNY